MSIHVIKAGDEYLVIQPYQINESHYARILLRNENLDTALKYAKLMEEGGVAVNSVASGHVKGFAPVMRFRDAVSRVKRRRTPTK
jgi:hypothetical protein